MHYPKLIHQQNVLNYSKAEEFPVAEKIHKEILSLPVYPELDNESHQKVIQAVNDFYA